MKLTKEQLSMVLGEHVSGGLVRYGSDTGWTRAAYETLDQPAGCIMQVACNEESCGIALALNRKLGGAFDVQYRPELTEEELLTLVENNQ